jgi:hypothetical protein
MFKQCFFNRIGGMNTTLITRKQSSFSKQPRSVPSLPFTCAQCTTHQLYVTKQEKEIQAKPLHTASIIVTIVAKVTP